MLFTLAAVILLATIITFFSKEFQRSFKKILDIKGAKLILPLMFASTVIYYFQAELIWIIYYYKQFLINTINLFAQLIPLSIGPSIMHVLVLTVICILPVILLDLLFQKKTYKPYPYPVITSTLLLIINALILLLA